MAFGTDYTPVGPMPTDIVLGDVDATSMRLARDIRDKGHGIDTRETMARMILKSSTMHNHLIKVNNALKVQNDEYYRQFTDVLKELSKDKDYYSLPEISGARGGFDTLGERLNDTAVQLGQKANKYDVFTMANMGQDIKEAMTGGSVAVVGENAVLTDNVTNNAITPMKTTLSNMLTNFFNTGEVPIFPTWELGGIVSSTGVDSTATYPSRIEGYLSKKGTYRIDTDLTTRSFILIEYDRDGVHKGYKDLTGALTYTFTVTDLNQYRIVVYNADRTVLTPNIADAKVQITYLDGTHERKSLSRYVANEVADLASIAIWEDGGIHTTTGEILANSYSIRTGNAFERNGKYIIETEVTNTVIFIALGKDGTVVETLESSNKLIHEYALKGDKLLKIVIFDTDRNLYLRASYAADNVKLSFKELSLSNLHGKTFNVLADSTASVAYELPNWWQIIADETGAKFNDYAVKGTSIASSENTIAHGEPLVNRYTTMTDNADGVIIMAGRNDNGVPLGEWSSTDINTFYGALNVMFKGLIEKYQGKPILVLTPIQSSGEYLTNEPFPIDTLKAKLPTDSIKCQHRAEAIKQKCNQYGLTCIDLFNESGINGADTGKVYYRLNDELHQSKLGHLKMAPIVKATMGSLF